MFVIKDEGKTKPRQHQLRTVTDLYETRTGAKQLKQTQSTTPQQRTTTTSQNIKNP